MANKNIRCAFYGSLKSGMYNNPKSKDIVSVKTLRIGGFKMYSLGSYPFIRKAEEKDKITVEIFNVSEEEFKWINIMEEGAGYTREIMDIDGEPTTIYVIRGGLYESNDRLVEDGNWKK